MAKNFKLYMCLLFSLSLNLVLSKESMNFLSAEDGKGNSTKGIRCFWLEPTYLSVYDLKGLKRPFGQK